MLATNTPLVAIELIAGSIWVGSLVCLAVVANAARGALEPPAQVAFFRAVGRRYAIVGTGSLLVSIGVGLALLWPPDDWSGPASATVALAGLLVVLTAAGMAQARAMTNRRRLAHSAPGDADIAAAVHRGQRRAGALRGTMALVTLAIVILAAVVVTS